MNEHPAPEPMEREPSRSERRPRGEAWSTLLLPTALILGLALLLGLQSRGISGAPEHTPSPIEHWLEVVFGYLSAAAEVAAALVIGVAIVRGIFEFLAGFFRRAPSAQEETEAIRIRLGRSLALGLEFTVASDILRTAVAPTREDILNLGAIVLLRTLLNYFLEREIRSGDERRAPASMRD